MFKTPEDRLSEIQLYELVAEELEQGEQSKGLWAKALAECVNDALEEMERLQNVNKEIARAAEVMAQISKTLE